MNQEDPERVLRRAIAEFADEYIDIKAFWSVFFSEYKVWAPLHGDALRLFEALEDWEATAGVEERELAVKRARTIARRIA